MDIGADKPKPKRSKSAAKALQFHKVEIPKPQSDFMKGIKYLPSNIQGMNQLFGSAGGYPVGGVFNLVGVPKCGKTTTLIYEALGWAQQGYPIWVLYNESTRQRYMELWNRHRTEMGIPDSTYKKLPITFVSAFGKRILTRPKYGFIRDRMKDWVQRPLEAYLKKGNKPAAIMVDSVTAFFREWAAQGFVFVEYIVSQLHDLFYEYKVRPVVFMVSQKASKEWGKDDEQGYGGYGPVHIMDGSIVISKQNVDTWFHRDTGYPIGSTQRFIRMDMRDVYGSEEMHHYTQEIDPITKQSGLYVGESLPKIIEKFKEEENGNGKRSTG